VTEITRDNLQAKVGHTIGTSRWHSVDQSMIDTFADVTFDHQFIHVDPERAAETPFGTTIAHGFLTLSLLSTMSYEAVLTLTGAKMGVNYGFDRLRFVSPVLVGSKVRGHFTLSEVKDLTPDLIQLALSVSVEIDGQSKPALIAEWLVRYYFEVPEQ
jgi:acyl dehydratase